MSESMGTTPTREEEMRGAQGGGSPPAGSETGPDQAVDTADTGGRQQGGGQGQTGGEQGGGDAGEQRGESEESGGSDESQRTGYGADEDQGV